MEVHSSSMAFDAFAAAERANDKASLRALMPKVQRLLARFAWHKKTADMVFTVPRLDCDGIMTDSGRSRQVLTVFCRRRTEKARNPRKVLPRFDPAKRTIGGAMVA